jgi:hypothetical protein
MRRLMTVYSNARKAMPQCYAMISRSLKQAIVNPGTKRNKKPASEAEGRMLW